MREEQAIESEIAAKGLNAPRLSPALIDDQIVDEAYHRFPDTTVTVCMLTLRNGFNVIGQSAAASPSNFDEAIGRRIARGDAREKIWALEGYTLRNLLSGRTPTLPRRSDEGAGRGMTFGQAVEAMKDGDRVAREGWNGKGMWLALTQGTPDLPAGKFWNPQNRAFAEANGGSASVLPTVTMKTATGEILMGWLASQTDMLAEDWMVVSASEDRAAA